MCSLKIFFVDLNHLLDNPWSVFYLFIYDDWYYYIIKFKTSITIYRCVRVFIKYMAVCRFTTAQWLKKICSTALWVCNIDACAHLFVFICNYCYFCIVVITKITIIILFLYFNGYYTDSVGGINLIFFLH